MVSDRQGPVGHREDRRPVFQIDTSLWAASIGARWQQTWLDNLEQIPDSSLV